MWELFLKWLPVFGWILGGTILLPGIMIGCYRSCRHILGYSNEILFGYSEHSQYLMEIHGILPLYLLTSGVFSVIGGLLAIARGGDVTPVYGIISGGVFGVVVIHFVKGLHWLAYHDYQMLANVIAIGVGGITGGIAGGFLGTIAGIIASICTIVAFFRPFENDDITGMIPGIGWIAGGVAGGIAGVFVVSDLASGFADKQYGEIMFSVSIGILVGVITGMLAGGLVAVMLFIEKMISNIVSSILTPLLISSRFVTMICSHCLRYTDRFQSRYEHGKRYCEYCNNEVERTRDPGKVIVTFGDIPLQPEGRIFMFSNPDFEQKEQPIDVSEVYIDANTCNKLLIERFITYIVNSPPTYGLESVRIFYRGKLDDLGTNLRNVFQNTFSHIEKVD